MTQDKFPAGTLVLIQLEGTPEQRLRACPGIVCGDGKPENKLVACLGGPRQNVFIGRMIPLALLSQEDRQKDPDVLLEERPNLDAAFQLAFGNALRSLVLA